MTAATPTSELNKMVAVRLSTGSSTVMHLGWSSHFNFCIHMETGKTTPQPSIASSCMDKTIHMQLTTKITCFSFMCKCVSEMHSFDKGRTKKLNESPTLSVGPPKKPMEVPRTLEHKTLWKSLRLAFQLENWNFRLCLSEIWQHSTCKLQQNLTLCPLPLPTSPKSWLTTLIKFCQLILYQTYLNWTETWQSQG